MTLKELYENIDGNYDQVIRVLRMEKLIDKHIRKVTQGGVIDKLLAAGKNMDPTEMFETAHTVKGFTANLGLTKLSELASQISEEFRPGKPRTMSDDEVAQKLSEMDALYQKTVEGIRQYIEG